MSRFINFFKHGGSLAWGLIAGVVLLLGASTALFAKTADIRYERDVTRMVFNDNLQLLEDVKRSVGATQDSLEQITAAAPDQPADRPDTRTRGGRPIGRSALATVTGQTVSG